MLRPRRLRRQLDRELQSLPNLKFALRFGGSLLELALYFSRTLTDIHGLAHCNERGRTRADAGRADNGDNLRWRNVDRGAMWSGERHEKIQDYRQNIGHVLLPLALNVGQLLRRVPIGLALLGTQRVLPLTPRYFSKATVRTALTRERFRPIRGPSQTRTASSA